MNNTTTLKQAWTQVLYKLAMVVPNAILGGEQKKHEHRDTVAKLIPFLIIVLSAASITNLSTRAYAHHAGFSSYLVGAGLAALVPLAVFVAIKIEGGWYKAAVWIIASIFAFISAAIQYQVYLPNTVPTMDQVLEALAFGAGVPAAECLLAAMEAFLLRQGDKHDETMALAEIEATRQAQATAEMQRQAEQVEVERRAQQAADRAHAERLREIELQAHADKLTQDAELERAEKLAQIRIKEAAAAAKVASKASSKSASNLDGKPASNTPMKVVKMDADDSEISAILDAYKQNPFASLASVGKMVGRSKQTIANRLKDLEEAKVIHKNGNGVEIL